MPPTMNYEQTVWIRLSIRYRCTFSALCRNPLILLFRKNSRLSGYGVYCFQLHGKPRKDYHSTAYGPIDRSKESIRTVLDNALITAIDITCTNPGYLLSISSNLCAAFVLTPCSLSVPIAIRYDTHYKL